MTMTRRRDAEDTERTRLADELAGLRAEIKALRTERDSTAELGKLRRDAGTVRWRGDFAPPGLGEQLRVYAIYDGCWHFSAGQPDEDVKLPPWPLAFRQGTSDEAPYSAVLTIDAPEGTRLVSVWPGGDQS